MKIQNLRLGNIISWNNKPRKIVGINSMTNNVTTIIDGCSFATSHWNIAKVEPIEITHEWLFKLGFELVSKHSFHNYKTKNGFWVSMWMEDKQIAGWEEKGVCYWSEQFVSVKYVHQLQNLYHAVCFGQELAIINSK